ncbi:MAG: SDR family oxidoreductase [bacterium]|nr:SDR family oxidoreductase [bacterium]
MHLFMTGGTGFIGSAVIPELLGAGHRVTALARSSEAAAKLEAMGATALPGSLDDLAAIERGARDSDGVIHLGFDHDFANMGRVSAMDTRAIEAMIDALAGSDRPLLVAAGLAGFTLDRPIAESDAPTIPEASFPRLTSGRVTLEAAQRGVRSMIVRFAPTVHGAGDRAFIPQLIRIARERGLAAYIDDGANRWAAVHRLDAARVVRLGIELASAGSVLHAVGEEGITTRAIAESFGAHLGVPVRSIAREQAHEHFGFLGMFFGANLAASNESTRSMLDWTPMHAGLLEDLADAPYFAPVGSR